MEFLFLSLYDYFRSHRVAFYFVFIGLFVIGGIGASRIKLEEDVSHFFPNDKRVEKLTSIFQGSRFAEKMVVMVSLNDSTASPAPDSLIAFTETLVADLQQNLKPYVADISYRVDDQLALRMFSTLHENLPIFLSPADYASIDSLLTPNIFRARIQNNYRQLISPAGIVLKQIIARDPAGISMLAIKKLRDIQYDQNYELYDNYVVTKDHRHLLLFLTPAFPPNETGKNTPFIDALDRSLENTTMQHPTIRGLYFGAAAVAVGNARQLRDDTILTVSLMVVLLIVFLFGFLRKKRAPFLILLPVLFGGLFSLSCIYIIKGSISVLAIAAGAVILGIAVNYSLHFLSHLRHTTNVRDVIKELVYPMTIGSTTTVLAFFCLQFANAGVLQDLGLFAGFSLIGAALCSLLFLPQLVKDDFFGRHQSETWVDRLAARQPESNKYLVFSILLLTPALYYFASDVKFNSNMNSLNFMNASMRDAELALNKVNRFSLRSVFIVTTGPSLDEALKNNDQLTPVLNDLKQKGIVGKFSSISDFIISDSLQNERIRRWNSYWTSEKKNQLRTILREEGSELKFSPVLYANFDTLLNHRYLPAEKETLEELRAGFFGDYITEKENETTVVTLAKVNDQQKEKLYSLLENYPHVYALDKQMLTNSFVGLIHDDFNFIVTFTSAIVFFALLLAYGRLELALITFVPMLISWIWILGIMALVGIEFNIINVMISTFIFGLGDDYSIFIMDGLQQEYRTGRKTLPSIKTSIFLSALTTISGLGVLIFAQHPALRSIAAVSIIGIVCVFVMSQTLEPFFFRLMISGPASRKQTPRTAWGSFKSFFPYAYFTTGALFLAVIGFLMLRVWPFQKEKMKLWFHIILKNFVGFIFPISMSVKPRILMSGQSLQKPAIIIANHQSFLDILITIALTPKILLVTNRWVWNSPVFGVVVKLAEYYPVDDGVDAPLERMKERLEQGYSILIFPEGTRSPDGQITRFHKGAFYLAQQLNADILPLLIHGSGELIRKNELYVDKGVMTLKFLPRISPEDQQFGNTYSERTKKISRYFKEEYVKLSQELETPAYFRRKLISNYLFKGPVLEWYLRVKLSLEKDYEPFHKIIPRQATVLDLGCGYGFLAYMLHFTSPQRQITGVDYDEDKIITARNAYSQSELVSFDYADITTYCPDKIYDVIIISDVLHYLAPDKQIAVMKTAFTSMAPDGIVIIREGNSDLKNKHEGTQLSEFFSTRFFRFNKAVNELSFMSGETIVAEATRYGLHTQILDDTKFTSNVIFVIRKRQQTGLS